MFSSMSLSPTFFVYCKQRSRYSKHRDQTILQVVVYKRLKTMESYKTIILKPFKP